VLLVVGGVLAAPSANAQSSRTGIELLRQCEGRGGQTDTEGQVLLIACVSYIAGMVDALRVAGALPRVHRLFCPPAQGVMNEQLLLVVTKWLREHPDQLHYEARSSVVIALAQAFPCAPQ
jgi:hypothetical protein